MSEKLKSKTKFVKFTGDGELTRSNVYWKEVLNEIFNRVPGAFGPGKFEDEDKNPIAKELKITDWELYRNVMFLQEIGLVEIRNEGQWTSMWPTSKGFDVALQNEKIKADSKRQLVIASLTAIIALSAMFSLLYSTKKYDSDIMVLFFIFGIIMIYIIPRLKVIISNLKNRLGSL